MRLLRSKLGDYEEEIRKKKNAAISADEWHSPFLQCLPTSRGFHVLYAKSKFLAAIIPSGFARSTNRFVWVVFL